ncbi:MAG: DVU0524 family FlgM-associated protein [Candidatus Jordarchaeum sp.]|uniref:DVU0524 family FlgM-associated protein n=1 Tax=Candidatus Jordarchaeum sp. TaxID=2823881 RepID=UPI00404B0E8C
MVIPDLQIQNILKAYSRQLSLRSKISKEKNEKNIIQKDKISLSAEGKKMWLIDKIAKEIIMQIGNGGERTDTLNEVLNRLSEEFGHPLEVIKENSKGLVFKVVDKENEANSMFLPQSENERLEKRLFEITKAYIYQQLS